MNISGEKKLIIDLHLGRVWKNNEKITSPAALVTVMLPSGCNTAALSLPPIQECFNSPYGTSFFSSYAEKIPGESTQMLSEAAKENKIYVVGGRTTRVLVERHRAGSGHGCQL